MLKEKQILIGLLLLLIIPAFILAVRTHYQSSDLNQEQAYLDNIKIANQPQNNLSEPLIKASDPVKGKKEAGVSLVVFGSFTCSYCSQVNSVLNTLLGKFPDKLKIIWKDYASVTDQTALRAAVAGRCAQQQDKFWEFHDNLLANQDNLNDSFYLKTADDLKLNLSKFQKCFESQETISLVQSDYAEGGLLQIDSLPYFFIKGQRISGLPTEAELTKIINQQ
jgi:protein-disulfide isomerase